MSVLYAPGDGTAESTKRSTEMIYRSHESVLRTKDASKKRLHDLFHDRCLGPYRSELPRILSGERDRAELPPERQPSHIMREFLTIREGEETYRFGFRRVPPGNATGPFVFTMGR